MRGCRCAAAVSGGGTADPPPAPVRCSAAPSKASAAASPQLAALSTRWFTTAIYPAANTTIRGPALIEDLA